MSDSLNVFYVYEHWRPDTDCCFYVGKGKNKRAWQFSSMRNPHYKSIVAKINDLGHQVDVRIIKSNLSHDDAISFEIERIAFYGVKNLSNMTLGGDGLKNPSEEVRAKISASQKKRFENPEAREKLKKVLKGRITSEETKKKLSKANKGRKHTEETREKMSAAAKIRIIPQHVRDAQRAAVTGRKRSPFSEETLRRMSKAAKLREAKKRERAA
jgi:hypothetical protein